MKIKKLIRLLSLVKGVWSNRWETVMDLVESIKEGGAVVKEKSWQDKFKESQPDYYPLDLSNLSKWSTYDETCIDLRFAIETTKNDSQEKTQLVCFVKIYDGRLLDGRREKLRFEAVIHLPDNFVRKIQNRIEWALEDYLESCYEAHLELQKRKWIHNLKEEILND